MPGARKVGRTSLTGARTRSSSSVVAMAGEGGLWSYTAKDIDGVDVDLSKFAGKVALVVNTASF